MGNTDKHKVKRCKRKIKIRLADPDVPDSYVCEVFDSSLENEEDNSNNERTLFEKKPENYFELLMPKKCKKNGMFKGVNQNEDVRYSHDEEFARKKLKDQKNLNSLTHSKIINCETGSLENESLFQIQENFKLKNFDLREENDCMVEVKGEEINNVDHQIGSRIEPPKIDSSQKKALGILGYFSKTPASQKNNNDSSLEEIIEVRPTLQTCKIKNQLKVVKQHDASKPHKKNLLLHGINKENVKLAPLFCKKEKIIDSATQKARLEFLYKSSSSSIVKKSENIASECVLNFPKISHIQQRNDNVCWSQRKICLPLPEISVSEDQTFKNHKKFSLQINCFNTVNNKATSCGSKVNEEFLCKVKCKYLELNLDCFIDGLKEKKDKFLARAEDIENLKTHQQDLIDDFEELAILWTDKYKPRSCEILGNENIVKKMKKWLLMWKLFDEELKALVRSSRSSKNKNDEDDDDDDLLDSDSENYGLKAPGNVCIISGPNGCGKTALVYALANELEFGVLELNASSKRTGKKVLSDLQEATQSHKVHRVNLTQSDALKNEIKKKRTRKKRKTKKLEPNKIFHQSNDSKISLILIEDADIIFDEHDEGFFSAITSLVQTSKRPVIFLSNEPNCHDLYNLKADQCLILEMEMPNFYISCAVLDIVSSLEGAHVDKEIIESVVRQNNCDLRKSLLQVQFWIHSGNGPINLERKFDLGHLWWGLSQFLYKQDIKHFMKPKSRKRRRVNELFDSSDDEIEIATKKFKSGADVSKGCLPSCLDLMPNTSKPSVGSYFKVLDSASVLDEFSLPGSQEPIPGFEYKVKDGLSLDENMEEVTWSWKNLAEQLSEELVSLSAKVFVGKEKENENWEISFVSPCWEEMRWRNSQEKATQELSTLVPLQRGRDRRSLHLDYLPVLRNICRVERNRSEMNPKRKNRFYHYLNNLGFELTNENLEINCDIFYQ